jgi:hypothetical protein
VSGSINIPVVSKFDPTGIKQAQTALGGFGKAVAGFGAIVAGAFAVRAIGNFAAETIRMGQEVLQSNAVLKQVAKTTGQFGGELDSVTNRLIKFADAQELRLGVDAEVVKSVQAQLLSFKALGASAGEAGGSFDRATKAAFDMAMVLKRDASGQAIALGKALEDPIRGITALRKGGTTFTAQQQEQIKTLVQSNRLLDAQALILTEVESQYGGAAEAGALYSDRFRLGLEQIKETIGIALIPSFEKFVNFFLADVVPPLTKFFEQDFPVLLEKLKPVAEDVMTFFSDIGQGLKDFLNIDADTSLLVGILDKFKEIGDNPEFQTFLDNVSTIFHTMAPALASVVANIAQLAVNLTPLLEEALGRIIPILSDTAGIFESINFFLGEILASFGVFEGETPDFIKALENQINPMGRLQDALRGLNQLLARAIDLYRTFRALGGQLPSEQATGGRRFDLPGRAGGGRVSGGSSYLVGEMGPELFMPGRGGNIVPNDRLGGGGTNITINVTAGMGTNGAQVGEQIVNAIKRYERTSGPVFAKA